MKKASVKVGNARLLKLAAFLRTVKPKQFDYNVWVRDDWKGAVDFSCGTAACALGWATTIPSFRRAGLHMTSRTSPFGGEPTLNGCADPFDAATKFFGLRAPTLESSWHSQNPDEVTDAAYLFAPADNEHKATPKQVAKKIERFVKARS